MTDGDESVGWVVGERFVGVGERQCFGERCTPERCTCYRHISTYTTARAYECSAVSKHLEVLAKVRRT